jgi:hypothetical protein
MPRNDRIFHLAGVTLDKLPPALGLNGTELVWLYQEGGNSVVPWVGVQCTTAQLAEFATSAAKVPYSFTTMRQLITVLGQLGLLIDVFNALPGDITDQYNIAWNHAPYMSASDPFVTGFLQPTLGFSDAQILGLFALSNNIWLYSPGMATMRQLISAMSEEGTLIGVFNQLPGDVTDPYNIAWDHALYVPLADPFISGFLQPALGYSSGQMQAFYAYALSFPA